jgi:hypothetical protein
MKARLIEKSVIASLKRSPDTNPSDGNRIIAASRSGDMPKDS